MPAVASLLLLALVACTPQREEPPPPVEAPPAPESAGPNSLFLTPATFEQLPAWGEDPMSAALPAFLRSCQKLAALPPDTPLGANAFAGYVHDWIPLCNTAWGLTPRDDIDMRGFMSRWFKPYLVSGADGPDGLFTGYFEPELYGSLEPRTPFNVPLYRKPDDMVSVDLGPFRSDLSGQSIVGRIENNRFVPYYSRAEIDQGALAGRGLELLWVDDPIDAFFLEIQGSGIVYLPDGSATRVGYAGKNGRAYVAIGKVLVEWGEMTLEQVSLADIEVGVDGIVTDHGGQMRRRAVAHQVALLDQRLAGPAGDRRGGAARGQRRAGPHAAGDRRRGTAGRERSAGPHAAGHGPLRDHAPLNPGARQG